MVNKLDLSFLKDPKCFNRLTITMFNSGETVDIPETPVTPEEDETDPDKPVVTEENASVSIELANVTDQNISDIESEEITVVQPTVDTDKGTIFSITKENIIID